MTVQASTDWVGLSDTIASLGPAGLAASARDIRRLVRADGITYGGAPADRPARPWKVDPLPVVLGADEWATLERGLDQRARLLDALLIDLTGPRTLLARRVLPAELVVGHDGWLLPALGITLPTRRQLPLVATDLMRTPSGQWLALSDRTQAPSGVGYAMANRRLTTRVLESLHRRTPLRQLRGFFDVMRAALREAAPAGVELPHIVLLSAGPASETAYDQALLATMLGHPLAQSDDLTITDGRLWLRTTGRPHRVDVVQRRVDAAWSDSLDLRADSRLGVPGLTAAARRGAVSVVNPLAAGILENSGLIPYLPRLIRELLGEEPLLEGPESFWCGDPAALAHVEAHLGELVIKPISRSTGAGALGWRLSQDERDALVRRMRANPWAWAAQRPVDGATTPTVGPNGAEERPFVLRTFGQALDGDYHFLPGGLARVAPEREEFVVTNAYGALAKDVWVLDDDQPQWRPVDIGRRGLAPDVALPGLTPRTAGNLYWMGRYSERTEFTARLLTVADNLVEDNVNRPGTPGHAAMTTTLEALSQVTGVWLEPTAASPVEGLRRLLVDDELPGTIAYAAGRTRLAAAGARELLSVDTFGILERLQASLGDSREAGDQVHLQPAAAQVLDASLALAGMVAESLVRDPIWAFLEAGRRVERAQSATRLLRNTIALVRPPVAEGLITETVLRAGDSLITYQRRMAFGVGPDLPVAAAVDLLLRDPANPRSVVAQLRSLVAAAALIPDDVAGAEACRIADTLASADAEQLCEGDREALVALLIDLEGDLRALSDTIEAVHFTAPLPQQSFTVQERTAAPGETAPAASDRHGHRRYEVRHRTHYAYDDDVSASYERAMLRPRETPSQRILSHDIGVDPTPGVLDEHIDALGNFSHYVELTTPHRHLTVTKTTVVDVEWPAVDLAALDVWTVEDAAAALASDPGVDATEHAAYLLGSPMVELSPPVVGFASGLVPPWRPLGDAIRAVFHEIYTRFRYDTSTTTVNTTLPELLDARAGVCQDFAHLAVACFRSAGLPARYVSGYIETQPPPGQPKLAGSDATHAWVSVMVPGGGWVDLDPTNDQLADSSYIVTAWGRDFGDVSPLKGVIFTDAKNSTLDVAVDVIRVD